MYVGVKEHRLDDEKNLMETQKSLIETVGRYPRAAKGNLAEKMAYGKLDVRGDRNLPVNSTKVLPLCYFLCV